MEGRLLFRAPKSDGAVSPELVVPGKKGAIVRAGFELSSEQVGVLPRGRKVVIVEEREGEGAVAFS